MTRIFLPTLAAIGLLSSSALAADMPVAYKAAPPVQRCAADQFRGGYIGVNGGAVNWTANRTDQDEVLVDTASYVQKTWAGMVGAQAGYNWGSCNTIYGFEVDGDWISGRANLALIPNASPLLNINIQSRWDALVTARGRAGVVIDNMLLYVTGGVAAGHFKTSYTNQFLGIAGVVPGFLFQANNNEWRWGLAAGVGAEWALGSNWTVRTEVLYVDFVETEHRYLFAPPATFANFKESDSAWITRVGVNYRFGGPVVAKY
jgi:outer membrane immunogenic protein